MIIALAGRKQSGKTSACEFISNAFVSNSLGMPKIYNFADPLKSLCIDILGLTYEQCYGTDEDKNTIVNCHWDNRQLTAREVMQIIGTDMFRKMQRNVWSDATIRKIHKESPDLALIADCRFPNEVEAVKQAGGLVIKLNRNLYNSDHASEMALDTERYNQNHFDLIIDNQSISLSQKNELIHQFLVNKGILPL